MHPLKFPDSGIRAKVFVRKIGFKLRVMRLYRIELFYVFLLHFRSEGNEEEGQPATTNPHAGPATHGQAAARASPKGGLAMPARAIADRGHDRLRPAHRGGSRLQRGAHMGLPPAARVATPWRGSCQRARATAACVGAVAAATTTAQRGKELGNPLEKITILPL
ncbi:hypothetical protein GW17_00057260 [Ensete ventricosum]|nr:hypothetical protein GW17_00057260 [Ensete ventricosum]